MPGIGLDLEAAEDIIKAWRKQGRAEFKGDAAVLSAAECTAQGIDKSDVAARRAVFTAIIENNGCAMTEETAERVLPAAGFDDKDESKGFVCDLMAAGQASSADDRLTLQTDNCR